MNWYKRSILAQGLLDLEAPITRLPSTEQYNSPAEGQLANLGRFQRKLYQQFLSSTGQKPMSREYYDKVKDQNNQEVYRLKSNNPRSSFPPISRDATVTLRVYWQVLAKMRHLKGILKGDKPTPLEHERRLDQAQPFIQKNQQAQPAQSQQAARPQPYAVQPKRQVA